MDVLEVKHSDYQTFIIRNDIRPNGIELVYPTVL